MSRSNGHKPYVPPPPETITYSDDGLDVTLTISRANGALGTYRTLLMQAAKDEESAPDISDLLAFGSYLTHLYVYPSLIAATVSAKGLYPWPLPFSGYMMLPERFLIAWETKVFELNPHWRPKGPEPEKHSEEDQKKVPSSAQG